MTENTRAEALEWIRKQSSDAGIDCPECHGTGTVPDPDKVDRPPAEILEEDFDHCTFPRCSCPVAVLCENDDGIDIGTLRYGLDLPTTDPERTYHV